MTFLLVNQRSRQITFGVATMVYAWTVQQQQGICLLSNMHPKVAIVSFPCHKKMKSKTNRAYRG